MLRSYSLSTSLPASDSRSPSQGTHEQLVNAFENFFAGQRQSAHAVEADGVDEVFGTQYAHELAAVDFRHEDLAVLAQDMAEVGRQRIQVPEVNRGHRLARGLRTLD